MTAQTDLTFVSENSDKANVRCKFQLILSLEEHTVTFLGTAAD